MASGIRDYVPESLSVVHIAVKKASYATLTQLGMRFSRLTRGQISLIHSEAAGDVWRPCRCPQHVCFVLGVRCWARAVVADLQGAGGLMSVVVSPAHHDKLIGSCGFRKSLI